MLSGGCLLWLPLELLRVFGTPSTLAATLASIFAQSEAAARTVPVADNARSVAAPAAMAVDRAIPYRVIGTLVLIGSTQSM